MKPLSTWLEESIEQYRELTLKTQALAEQIPLLSPDAVLERCSEIQQMQQDIASSDQQMFEIMNFVGPEALDLAETGEYQRALEQAIKASDQVASKARTYKEMLNREINRIQDGQKVVTKYHSGIDRERGNTLQKEYL